jgi:hypothetical protein
VGGSLNLIYGPTSPTLCYTIADLPPTRQKRAKPSSPHTEHRPEETNEKGKEKQDNPEELEDEHQFEDENDDGDHEEEDDSVEERVGDRLALEFESLFVQTWGSLLQTRVEISADTLSVFEYLALPPHYAQEEPRSEKRYRSFFLCGYCLL